MASVTTEFKFVDVNNPSKGPPFESWERHKAPILQKYATMCLRDVKISMEEEFQFFATKDSYKYHLKKWDVCKDDRNGRIFVGSQPFHAPTPNSASSPSESLSPESLSQLSRSGEESSQALPNSNTGLVENTTNVSLEASFSSELRAGSIESPSAGSSVKDQIPTSEFGDLSSPFYALLHCPNPVEALRGLSQVDCSLDSLDFGQRIQRVDSEPVGAVRHYVHALRDAIIRADPGPFALKDGVLGNACIKDCLWWSLKHVENMPNKTHVLWYGNLQAVGDLYSDCGLEATLFCNLLESWGNEEHVVSRFRVEERIGLSAVNLISIISVMLAKIGNHDCSGASTADWPTCIRQLWQTSKTLLGEDDRLLASAFLDSICCFKWERGNPADDPFAAIPTDIAWAFKTPLPSPETQSQLVRTASETPPVVWPWKTEHSLRQILGKAPSSINSKGTWASLKRAKDRAAQNLLDPPALSWSGHDLMDEDMETISDLVSCLNFE